MALALDTGLPSTRQVQTMIREEKAVELKLLTGDVLVGMLRWQDPHCICISENGDIPTIVWRQSIAFIKPKL